MPGLPSETGGQRGFNRCTEERGVVLVSVLLLLAVLTVVSAASMTATQMDLRISGYYNKSVVVFYIAEGGANRARRELSDGDGDRDFSSILAPTTIFQAEVLNGGSYTVVAAPVQGTVPAQLEIRSTGCFPAAHPCPQTNARSVVELLLELNPEAVEPEDRVRLIAWREAY